jgi:hypothetical protein
MRNNVKYHGGFCVTAIENIQFSLFLLFVIKYDVNEFLLFYEKIFLVT